MILILVESPRIGRYPRPVCWLPRFWKGRLTKKDQAEIRFIVETSIYCCALFRQRSPLFFVPVSNVCYDNVLPNLRKASFACTANPKNTLIPSQMVKTTIFCMVFRQNAGNAKVYRFSFAIDIELIDIATN